MLQWVAFSMLYKNLLNRNRIWNCLTAKWSTEASKDIVCGIVIKRRKKIEREWYNNISQCVKEEKKHLRMYHTLILLLYTPSGPWIDFFLSYFSRSHFDNTIHPLVYTTMTLLQSTFLLLYFQWNGIDMGNWEFSSATGRMPERVFLLVCGFILEITSFFFWKLPDVHA